MDGCRMVTLHYCQLLLPVLLLLFCPPAGVETKQNVKQRLQRLLIRCSLCWGRRPHSPAAELWTGVETGKLFLWCPGWWLWCDCQSPGLAQLPCHPMCLLFLWQRGITCVCLPAWNTWQSCVVPLDELPPLGWTPCERRVTLHRCLGLWHPKPVVSL